MVKGNGPLSPPTPPHRGPLSPPTPPHRGFTHPTSPPKYDAQCSHLTTPSLSNTISHLPSPIISHPSSPSYSTLPSPPISQRTTSPIPHLTTPPMTHPSPPMFSISPYSCSSLYPCGPPVTPTSCIKSPTVSNQTFPTISNHTFPTISDHASSINSFHSEEKSSLSRCQATQFLNIPSPAWRTSDLSSPGSVRHCQVCLCTIGKGGECPSCPITSPQKNRSPSLIVSPCESHCCSFYCGNKKISTGKLSAFHLYFVLGIMGFIGFWLVLLLRLYLPESYWTWSYLENLTRFLQECWANWKREAKFESNASLNSMYETRTRLSINTTKMKYPDAY